MIYFFKSTFDLDKNLFSLDCDVPPGHQKTPTEDGTFTLENLSFQENCHSTAGAYQETLFNYIQGTEIQKKVHLPEINIFEVGFGLGFGLGCGLRLRPLAPWPRLLRRLAAAWGVPLRWFRFQATRGSLRGRSPLILCERGFGGAAAPPNWSAR